MPADSQPFDTGPVHICASGPVEGTGPAGEGAYHIPIQAEAVMTWSRICQVCANESLEYLDRHPRCQQRYDEWAVGIRAKYGGLEAYIKKWRLGWDDIGPALEDGFVQGDFGGQKGSDGEANWHGHLSFHPSMPESMAKCIANDWPYGVPACCGHYVVWCRLPIIHPSLFDTPDTPFEKGRMTDAIYEAVAQDGIRGFTGVDVEEVVREEWRLQQQQASSSSSAATTPLSEPPPDWVAQQRGNYRVVGEKTVQLLRKSKEVPTVTPALSASATPVFAPTPTGGGGRPVSPLELRKSLTSHLHAASASVPGGTMANGDPHAHFNLPSNDAAAPTASAKMLTPVEAEHAIDLASRAQAWAGRYVSAYVEQRWPPKDGWECAWFCNPPHLRTVPSLSHFHVMPRRKTKLSTV